MIHDPDRLLGKFIDFNYEPVSIRKENVRKLPEEFSSIPPFVSLLSLLFIKVSRTNFSNNE